MSACLADRAHSPGRAPRPTQSTHCPSNCSPLAAIAQHLSLRNQIMLLIQGRPAQLPFGTLTATKADPPAAVEPNQPGRLSCARRQPPRRVTEPVARRSASVLLRWTTVGLAPDAPLGGANRPDRPSRSTRRRPGRVASPAYSTNSTATATRVTPGQTTAVDHDAAAVTLAEPHGPSIPLSRRELIRR